MNCPEIFHGGREPLLLRDWNHQVCHAIRRYMMLKLLPNAATNGDRDESPFVAA